MLARLVSHDQSDLALTFAGEDRALQIHLLQLLCAASCHVEVELLARHLGVPIPSAPGETARKGAAASQSTASPTMTAHIVERSTGAALSTGGSVVPIGQLRPYELPPGTTVECFARPEQSSEANAALAAMHGAARHDARHPVLGLDAEWVAGRSISLLQLAIRGRCILLRMCSLAGSESGSEGVWPRALVELLADSAVLKTGIGIGHDLKLLFEQYKLPTAGVVELQPLASREGFLGAGLQRLSADVLGVHLDKRPQLRCSDWEAETLSPEQLSYAAKDAHVAVEIFERLYDMHADLCVKVPPLALAWCEALIDCEGKRTGRRQSHQPPLPLHGQQLPTGSATEEAPWGAHVDTSGMDIVSSAAVPLTSADLLQKVCALGLAAQARLLPDSVEAQQTCLAIKSLALFVGSAPVVAVVAAHAKLDRIKLAREMKLLLSSRRALSKQVRLATPAECITTFGYRPGTVPPIGHRLDLIPLVLDVECAHSSKPLLAGGGDFGTLLQIEAEALSTLPNASVAEIAEGPEPSRIASVAEAAGAPAADYWASAKTGTTSHSGAGPHSCDTFSPPRMQLFQGVQNTARPGVELPTLPSPPPRLLPPLSHVLQGLRIAPEETSEGAAPALLAPGEGRSVPIMALAHGEGSSVPSRASRLSGGLHGRRIAHAAEPSFLVDAMMGRLLRWLRVLGVDSLLREEGESLSALFTRAHEERRILLTRDRKLAERRGCGHVAVFVVSSDESREQLREVVAHFGLRLSADEFMMRCSVCNGRGYIKLTKVQVATRNDCPPKVFEAIDEFYACRSCDKLYWEGPKSNNAFEHFSSVFDGFAPNQSP